MNPWVKVVLAIFSCGVTWFFLKPFFGFNELFAILISVGFIVFFVFVDRINWLLLFERERDVLSLAEWKPKAVSALERNHPRGLANHGFKFEADILYSVPIGVLWVARSGPSFCECAFGEVWADSKNTIVSPLKDLNSHLHDTHTKSIEDAGRVYLRDFAKVKVKEQNFEEVSG